MSDQSTPAVPQPLLGDECLALQALMPSAAPATRPLAPRTASLHSSTSAVWLPGNAQEREGHCKSSDTSIVMFGYEYFSFAKALARRPAAATSVLLPYPLTAQRAGLGACSQPLSFTTYSEGLAPQLALRHYRANLATGTCMEGSHGAATNRTCQSAKSLFIWTCTEEGKV